MRFVLILSLFLTHGVAALAEVARLSAAQAHEAMQENSMIVLDIRRPEEWQATGVAKGAWPLDMRDADFGARLGAIIDRNPSRRLALICATGVRSAYVAKILDANGIEVFDISEGMMGSIKGQGWLRRGLPVTPAGMALEAIPKDLRSR